MEEQFDFQKNFLSDDKIAFASFDFNEVLKEFRDGKRLTGKGELLAPLIKQLTEAEVESHIA